MSRRSTLERVRARAAVVLCVREATARIDEGVVIPLSTSLTMPTMGIATSRGVPRVESEGLRSSDMPRKRNLLYVAPRFPVPSETFVYREVCALRAAGWRVRTSGLRATGTSTVPDLAELGRNTVQIYGAGAVRLLRDAAIELLRRPSRGLRTLGLAAIDAIAPGEPLSWSGRAKLLGQAMAGLALARRVRADGIGHVHAHFAHASASVAMYVAAQLGVPFSFTGHANDLFQRRALLKRKLERAAFVACISVWHRGFYEAIASDADGKYRVIRCAVDVAAWAPAERLLQPQVPFTILFVGRLVEKKGADTLIEALSLLRRTGAPVHLIMAGDGPLRDSLEALAIRLDCAPAVTFLGAVDNERVRSLMGDADAFALPCRTDAQGDRDGIPVVLMEAMACGRPVVSGDLPAIRELIVDGETGRLVPGGDVAALAHALDDLRVDPGACVRLGGAGRDRVVQEFSQEVNLRRLTLALEMANGRTISHERP